MDISVLSSLLPGDWSVWVQLVLAIIGAVAVAAAQLPPVKEDSSLAYKTIRAILDIVAQNYHNASNKTP